MKLSLQFDMDNAAFDYDWGQEAARILRKVADIAEQGFKGEALYDLYGNRIGSWKIED